MKKRTGNALTVLLTLFVMTVFLVHTAKADEMKTGEKRITFESKAKGVKGEAVIKDIDGKKEIKIRAEGLKKNAVYTVWLVNEKPKMDMMGVGEPDYAFTTDDAGVGEYTATVSREDLEKWELLEVAYHPDGDPKNMENIEIVLRREIKKRKMMK